MFCGTTVVALLTALLSSTSLQAADWPSLAEPAPAHGGGEHDAAVVIAIEDYAIVPDVEGALDNGHAWYDWLVHTRGVPAQSVFTLTDLTTDPDEYSADERSLQQARATRDGILIEVDKAVKQVGEDGVLWFVFIGHGVPGDMDTKLEDDGQLADGALVAHNASLNPEGFYDATVPRRTLVERLEERGPGKVVMVLDSCFGGSSPVYKSITDGLQLVITEDEFREWIEEIESRPSIAVLSASQHDEFAGSAPYLRRPAYSYLLLGALRGWADPDGDDGISLGEAHEFTKAQLAQIVKGRTQVPGFDGVGADWVLATPANPEPLPRFPSYGAPPAHDTGQGSSLRLGASAVDVDTLIDRLGVAGSSYTAQALELQREVQAVWEKIEPGLSNPAAALDAVLAFYQRWAPAELEIDGTTHKVALPAVDKAWSWLSRQGAEERAEASLPREREVRVEGVAYPMVRVPRGSFVMGKTLGQLRSPPVDRPPRSTHPHQAEVPYELWVGATEVTQEFFQAVMNSNPVDQGHQTIMGKAVTSERHRACRDYGLDGPMPVFCVSWVEAAEFCNRLSDMTHYSRAYTIQGDQVSWNRGADGFRLPTEAEWEYAARAGSRTIYTGTDQPEEVCRYANVADESAANSHRGSAMAGDMDFMPCSDGDGTLSYVAQLEPNAWGLYDTTGNVAEWVWDAKAPYPEELEAVHQTVDEGDYRMARGGWFLSRPANLELDYRQGRLPPTDERAMVGFRIVRGVVGE